MIELLQILDGGIIKERGKPVGVIRFMISTNEGAPEQLTGYCHPNYRYSIIKNPIRLGWRKPDRNMNVKDCQCVCRVCGCTQDHVYEDGCFWVDDDPLISCSLRSQDIRRLIEGLSQ